MLAVIIKIPKKTLLLTPKHVKDNGACQKIYGKLLSFWNFVMWSDEIKIELFGGNMVNHLWREKKKNLHTNQRTLFDSDTQ